MKPVTLPFELSLVAGFVNTLRLDTGADSISTPEGLAAWLRANGIPQAATPGPADVAAGIRIREAIRDLLEANAGAPVTARTLDVLNAAAARAPLVVRFDPRPRLEPLAPGGASGALARIMAAVHTLFRDGSWERLKPCRAADCRWVFYDRSRNLSGRWCSMSGCGNRAKARAFRERT